MKSLNKRAQPAPTSKPGVKGRAPSDILEDDGTHVDGLICSVSDGAGRVRVRLSKESDAQLRPMLFEVFDDQTERPRDYRYSARLSVAATRALIQNLARALGLA